MRSNLLKLLFMLLVIASSAQSQNQYYVSPTGSDSNDGSAAHPWLTIGHADASLALGTGSGSTVNNCGATYWPGKSNVATCVHVAPGTYNGTTIATTHTGTSTQRIVFISDTKYGAKVNLTDASSATVWVLHGNYNGIVGFEVTTSVVNNVSTYGVTLTGTNEFVIANKIHDLANGTSASDGISSPCPTNGGGGVHIQDISQTDFDVSYNLVYRIGSAGTCNKVHGLYLSGTRVIVQNNIVWGNACMGIGMGHSAYSVISNNTVFNNGGFPSECAGGEQADGDHNLWSNNIFYNNSAGADTGFGHGCAIWDNGTGATSSSFLNNDIRNDATGNGLGTTSPNCIDLRSGSGNTVTGTFSGTVYVPSITTSPGFVNYLSNGSGDYHLAATSANRNAGVTTCVSGGPSPCVPLFDFDMNSRPVNALWDIGAYEIGNSYYISPTGLDTNSGTSTSAPFKTFAYAIPLLQPGDVLNAMDGTYSSALGTGLPQINCSSGAHNGTSTAPITIQALNERKAHLQGTGAGSVFNMNNCSYWTIIGLYISETDLNVVRAQGTWQVSNSSNIVAKRNLIYHPNRCGNNNTMEFDNVVNPLVEENEVYYYHRWGIVTGSGGSGGEFRRNYANPRGAFTDPNSVCTTYGSGPPGFGPYGANGTLWENNISETGGFENEATSSNNTYLGNVMLRSRFVYGPHDSDSVQPNANTLTNNVVVNVDTAAFWLRGGKNSTLKHDSAFGNSGDVMGFGLDPGPGGNFPIGYTGGFSWTITDSQATGFTAASDGAFFVNTAATNQGGGATFSYNHNNNFNSSTTYNPNTNVSSPLTLNPGYGTCYLWAPDSSPLKGAASDGGDVGATVLYQYVSGVLTATRLWDTTTGAPLFAGATVTGVNDVSGSSLFDVANRINVNRNGCAFPSSYAGTAPATSYFISPSGNDGNNGKSTSAPFKTFAHAIPFLNPGDTLNLMNGTYGAAEGTGYPYINCSSGARSGTSGSPVSIQALNERQAFIKNELANGSNNEALFIQNCAYWNVVGLHVESLDIPSPSHGDAAIQVLNSNHIQFRRNIVAHSNRCSNTMLVEWNNSTDSLVEENEYYYFHRHAQTFWSNSNRNEARRNYFNPRTYNSTPFTCSSGTYDPIGDQSTAFNYGSSSNTIENDISENANFGAGNENIGEYPNLCSAVSSNNSWMGNIFMSANYGLNSHPHSQGSTCEMHNLTFVNDVVVNPNIAGAYLRAVFGGVLQNVTLFSSTVNSINYAQDVPSDGGGMIFPDPIGATVTNTEIVPNTGLPGYNRGGINPGTLSLDHSGAYGASIGNPTSNTNQITANPSFGSCKIWVPNASPLKGAGASGADVGANVLYRYEGGLLTTTRLWDTTGAPLFAGATVAGLNDIGAGGCGRSNNTGNGCSLFDIASRLNINQNGCSFPAGYQPGSGPSAPTGLTATVN